MARKRVLLLALAALVLIWTVAIGGYVGAKSSRVTAETVQNYVGATDFGKLSGAKREKALNDLAAMINALSLEERRRVRMEGVWTGWFEQMTEEEKIRFIEATFPTGFKKMFAAFEEMAPERRQKIVSDATKRLAESVRGPFESGNQPGFSEDLQKKITAIGLRTFYSESSAQTKAEVAPLLEEIQRSMTTRRHYGR
jgi:hypothetical protein